MGRGLSARQRYIMAALPLINALTVYDAAELLWKRKLRLRNEEPPATASFSSRSTREIRQVSSVYRMMAMLAARGLVAYPEGVRPREWYLTIWKYGLPGVFFDSGHKAAWVWARNDGIHFRCGGRRWFLKFPETGLPPRKEFLASVRRGRGRMVTEQEGSSGSNERATSEAHPSECVTQDGRVDGTQPTQAG